MGRVFGKESQYPSAGQRWTKKEEEFLIESFEKKLTMDQLVAIIGRGPGGTFLRLKKLKLVPEDLELEGYDRYTGEIWNRISIQKFGSEKYYVRKRV